MVFLAQLSVLVGILCCLWVINWLCKWVIVLHDRMKTYSQIRAFYDAIEGEGLNLNDWSSRYLLFVCVISVLLFGILLLHLITYPVALWLYPSLVRK